LADDPTPTPQRVPLGGGRYALVATGNDERGEAVPSRTCQSCGAPFARKSNRGPWPRYCPACRESSPTKTWVSQRTATVLLVDVENAVEDPAEGSAGSGTGLVSMQAHGLLESTVDWLDSQLPVGPGLGVLLVSTAGAFFLGAMAVWALSLALTSH